MNITEQYLTDEYTKYLQSEFKNNIKLSINISDSNNDYIILNMIASNIFNSDFKLSYNIPVRKSINDYLSHGKTYTSDLEHFIYLELYKRNTIDSCKLYKKILRLFINQKDYHAQRFTVKSIADDADTSSRNVELILNELRNKGIVIKEYIEGLDCDNDVYMLRYRYEQEINKYMTGYDFDANKCGIKRGTAKEITMKELERCNNR